MRTPTLLIAVALSLAPLVGFAEDKPAKPETKTETKPEAKPGKFKWYTSIKQARKLATEEKKPVLMLFTGSDWCPYCVKLEKEILSKKEFKDWAKDNVILYIADAKGGPDKLSAENKKMMHDYGAHGFPTIVFTDAEGKKFASDGYRKMPAADYVKGLEGHLNSAK